MYARLCVVGILSLGAHVYGGIVEMDEEGDRGVMDHGWSLTEALEGVRVRLKPWYAACGNRPL
jgi:hypothetical protein